tara:strand:+ start:620 stop:1105 length:486 start_codon:yes stop_codon:yes gene_type:complete
LYFYKKKENMDLTGIFTIGGKPGLQKLVAKSPNGVIVESLIDGKRFNAYSSYKISSLEDISIYCENEDVPLSEVLVKIAENNQFKEISVPEKGDLFSAITSYVPIDQERVYESDVKKLFTWYNLLVKNGILTSTESTKETADEAENPKEKEEENKDIKAKA